MSWYSREVVAPHDGRRGLVPSIGQRLIAGAHVLAGAYTGEPQRFILYPSFSSRAIRTPNHPTSLNTLRKLFCHIPPD